MKKILLFAVFSLAFYQLTAQPADYYSSAEGLSGEELKAELQTIIDEHTSLSYDALWNAYDETDLREDGTIWDMYSDNPDGSNPYNYTYSSDQCGNYSSEGSCYNREHSFPKSWYGEAAPINTDLFHIYPTDGYVNGMRSNLPYGNVETPSWTSENGTQKGSCAHPDYSGNVFEPIDEYKGDFARTYFYMMTRYYGQVSNWSSDMLSGGGLAGWALETLLEWHNQDPVSTKETERNDAVYQKQNNRNPFIDHPEYVQDIWDETLPQPSNHAANFQIAEAVELSWQPVGDYTTHYLIMKNTTGCSDFTMPTDGEQYQDNQNRINLNADSISYTWYVDPAQQSYFFMIIPYNQTSYDYKTDGSIPCTEVAVEE